MDDLKRDKIEDCVRQIQKRNPNSVSELHSLLSNDLYFIAIKYLRNKYDAEDLIQDFWLNIYTIVDKCWYFSNASSFLTKTFNNMALTRLKSLNRGFIPVDQFVIENYENLCCDFDMDMESVLINETFLKATRSMTSEELQVFSLIYYQEMSIRQIAQETNFSKSKVGRLKQQSEEKLKQMVYEDGWDKTMM